MVSEVQKAVFAACMAMFCEGFYATQTFPFASFMIEHLHGSKKNLGLWTGLYFTAYPVGSLLTSNYMGGLSNFYGRRTMLLASVTISLVLVSFMAVSNVYILQVVLRFIQGLTNCTLPMARTCLRERIQELKGDEVRAFSLLQTAFAASSMVGPAVGGFLYGLPRHQDLFLPWAVPLFVSVALYGTTIIITMLFMVETVDMDVPTEIRRQSSREVNVFRDVRINYYFVMVSAHSFVFTGWEVGYPLLARNSSLQHWTSSMIGVTFMVGSVGLLIHTLVTFPIMIRKWGLHFVWSSSWIVCIVVIACFPRIMKLLLADGYDGRSHVVSGANYVAQLFISVLQGCNFTTLQFILNNLVSLRTDSEYALPLANGWAAALQGLARAISPSLTGVLIEVDSIFDGVMSFDALAVIAIVCCLMCGIGLQMSLTKRASAMELRKAQGYSKFHDGDTHENSLSPLLRIT